MLYMFLSQQYSNVIKRDTNQTFVKLVRISISIILDMVRKLNVYNDKLLSYYAIVL